jgi:hypothetical protein
MIDEKELSTALHHLAVSDETGTAPIDGLLRRGRRARFNRITLTAGVAVATVGLAAGLAAVAQPDQPGPVPLDLAAQTTQRTTFRFEQTFSFKGPAGETILPAGAPYQGAYDPVHDRGYRIRVMPGEPRLTEEERQIGDACYFHVGQDTPWHVSSMSAKFPACWQLTDSAEGSALGVSASPGDLLAELEHVGEVSYVGRTATGKHKVDTYRFIYRYPVDVGPNQQRTLEKHGTVDIDVATHRIIHLAYGSTDVTGDRKYMLSASQDLTFSYFGTPVVVQEPTNIAER